MAEHILTVPPWPQGDKSHEKKNSGSYHLVALNLFFQHILRLAVPATVFFHILANP